MDMHYRFTGKTMVNRNGVLLKQVEFFNSKGDKNFLGGWIEKEENLQGNARVLSEAEVFGDAKIERNATITNRARVYGNAIITGNAVIRDHAEVFDNSIVTGDTYVGGNAQISGVAIIKDSVRVDGDCRIMGGTIEGNARIDGMAEITCSDDYCVFQSFGSARRSTTVYRQLDGAIRINCGCFHGDLDEFIEAVEKTHGETHYGDEYRAIIKVIKIRFNL